MTPWPVWFEVGFGRVGITSPLEQSISQRAKDRFGVLPPDRLKRAPTVRNVDRLVADISKIPHAVTAKDFKNLLRPCRSRQTNDCGISPRLIPVVHRLR